MSFFASKLSEEAKKIENFPKFQRYMEKTNTFKCKPPEVYFTVRNRVPYHKLLTNLSLLEPYQGILVLGRFRTDLAALGPYCHRPQANNPQNEPRARLVRG